MRTNKKYQMNFVDFLLIEFGFKDAGDLSVGGDKMQERKEISLSTALAGIKNKQRQKDNTVNEQAKEWQKVFEETREEIIKTAVDKHSPKFSAKNHEPLVEWLEDLFLGLERHFQNSPHFSRLAIIVLLSLMISIPLAVMNFTSSNRIKLSSIAPKTIINPVVLSPEAKAKYILENSASILAKNKKVFKFNRDEIFGKVAGVSEEADYQLPKQAQKIPQVKKLERTLITWLKSLFR